MISVQYKLLSQLRPASRNPKLHDIPQIKASISRFGFVLPLVEDGTTGKLVAGHGRLEALNAMWVDGAEPPARIKVVGHDWAVPVLTGVAFDSEEDAEGYLVADNRLVEAGGWDTVGLSDMLRDLKTHNVEAIGWSKSDIDQLLVETNAPSTIKAEPVTAPVDDATIKQIVLYFLPAEFDRVIERLQVVMDKHGLEDHTSVFLHLLGVHEAQRQLQ